MRPDRIVVRSESGRRGGGRPALPALNTGHDGGAEHRAPTAPPQSPGLGWEALGGALGHFDQAALRIWCAERRCGALLRVTAGPGGQRRLTEVLGARVGWRTAPAMSCRRGGPCVCVCVCVSYCVKEGSARAWRLRCVRCCGTVWCDPAVCRVRRNSSWRCPMRSAGSDARAPVRRGCVGVASRCSARRRHAAVGRRWSSACVPPHLSAAVAVATTCCAWPRAPPDSRRTCRWAEVLSSARWTFLRR